MGQPHREITQEQVLAVAETLAVASEQMANVALGMRENGMKKAIFAWSARQDVCVSLVARLCRSCAEFLPEQILEAKTGVKSALRADWERSQKQVVQKSKPSTSAGAAKRPKKRTPKK